MHAGDCIQLGATTPLQAPQGFAQLTHQAARLKHFLHFVIIDQLPLGGVGLRLRLRDNADRHHAPYGLDRCADDLLAQGYAQAQKFLAAQGLLVAARQQALFIQEPNGGVEHPFQAVGQVAIQRLPQGLDHWQLLRLHPSPPTRCLSPSATGFRCHRSTIYLRIEFDRRLVAFQAFFYDHPQP
ncbi:hypothetical protein D3C72_1552250 [compost metagenome]